MTQIDHTLAAERELNSTLVAYQHALVAMGIRVAEPGSVQVALSAHFAQVGELIGHRGICEVVPHQGISPGQKFGLLQFADKLWGLVACGRYPHGWVHYPDGTWRVVVHLPHLLGLSASAPSSSLRTAGSGGGV